MPRHHLRPPGKHSWCKWQPAQVLGIEFKPPIPEAIVILLKPTYARLGSPLLLQKYLEWYTQNANEALHSTVWKLCPKELFLVKCGHRLINCRVQIQWWGICSVQKDWTLISVSMCSEWETDCVYKNRNTIKNDGIITSHAQHSETEWTSWQIQEQPTS